MCASACVCVCICVKIRIWNSILCEWNICRIKEYFADALGCMVAGKQHCDGSVDLTQTMSM